MDSINSPQIISIVSSSVPYTPFATLWIPNTAKCVVLGENPRRTGNISIYQLDFNNKNQNQNQNDNDEKCENKKDTLKLQMRETKASGFKCGTFGQSYDNFNDKENESWQHVQLATGDFNGTLNIWDLEKLNKPIFCASNAHTKIINCIDGISSSNGGNGAAELVTGSRDGTVKVWDPRTIKHVSEMRASKNNNNTSTSSGRDCWSVCFGNSYNAQNRMIAAGYDNGDVKVLDLRTNKIYFETNVNNGVCCIEFDRKDIKLNKLVITSLESQYRVYDMKTKHISDGFAYLNIENDNDKKKKKKKKGTTIWQCRHLPQNRDIWITCLGNGNVNIWKYIYPDERFIVDDKGYKKGVMGEVKLLSNQTLSTLSTQPIVSWNWNRTKIGLACMASLDQTIQIVVVTKLNKL